MTLKLAAATYKCMHGLEKQVSNIIIQRQQGSCAAITQIPKVSSSPTPGPRFSNRSHAQSEPVVSEARFSLSYTHLCHPSPLEVRAGSLALSKGHRPTGSVLVRRENRSPSGPQRQYRRCRVVVVDLPNSNYPS
jgi:hypothetical protein